MYRFSFAVAGVGVEVSLPVPPDRFNDYSFYRDFVSGSDAPTQAGLTLHLGKKAPALDTSSSFCADNWQLFSGSGRHVLRLGPALGRADNTTVFSADYSTGEMYQPAVFELFRRFVDQFLIINLLSRESGFLMHASGVVWEGKGIGFVGPSGAGKSTILNLFAGQLSREALLNDDRLGLRRDGEMWRVYGTPWYGESRVSSSGWAPLAALFFLRQTPHNYVRRLSAPEICPLLMKQAMLPVWDAAATGRVCDTFGDLIRCVPAFELGFRPDESAVELVKDTVRPL